MNTPNDELDALRTRLPSDQLDSMATRCAVAPAAGNETPQQRDIELAIGEVLENKFLIVRPLGRGSMGIVYEAIEIATQVRYAIKLLNSDFCRDSVGIKSLRMEIATSQAATHQNLLKVNYLVEQPDRAYIVMEYLDGNDLRVYVQQQGGRLAFKEVRSIASQIAAGLDYLNDKGFIHRDLKPENIFVTTGGEIRIIDFGISSASRGGGTGLVGGTLAYMAPEQLRKEQVDRRTDVYAFALVVAELISGALPFDIKDPRAVLAWHLDPMHELDLELDPLVRDTCELALSADPNMRPNRCADFLFACMPSESTQTKSGPVRPPLPRIDADAAWASHRNGILKRIDDLYKLRGPMASHPDNLFSDAQYSLSKWSEFMGQTFWKTEAGDAQRRFEMCLTGIERWAFFYSEYRHPFVILWNQACEVTKSPRISEAYFLHETVIARHKFDDDQRSGGKGNTAQKGASRMPSETGNNSTTKIRAIPPITMEGLEETHRKRKVKSFSSRVLKVSFWIGLSFGGLGLALMAVAEVIELAADAALESHGNSNDLCSTQEDCEFGSYCMSGVCLDGNLGDRCSNDGRCDHGYYCAGGVCRDGSSGDPCGKTGEHCDNGYYCANHFCRNGDSGDPCSFDGLCGIGHICVDSTCRACPNGICDGGRSDSQCGTDGPCLIGSYCINGTCYSGREGDPCSSDMRCGAGYYCVSSKCYRGAQGDPCATNARCGRGYYCSGDVCYPGHVGDPCSVEGRCGSNTYCVSGVCYRGNPGEPCSEDGRCRSQYHCVDNTCRK